MKRLLLFAFFGLLNISVFAQVDYGTEIQPILANNCNSCHSGGGNGFDSSPYNDLIASTSSTYNRNHIIPGDANNSPLVDKIEANPQVGSRMPQGGQLTTDQINKIKLSLFFIHNQHLINGILFLYFTNQLNNNFTLNHIN